jgi:hypothetical protein
VNQCPQNTFKKKLLGRIYFSIYRGGGEKKRERETFPVPHIGNGSKDSHRTIFFHSLSEVSFQDPSGYLGFDFLKWLNFLML